MNGRLLYSFLTTFGNGRDNIVEAVNRNNRDFIHEIPQGDNLFSYRPEIAAAIFRNPDLCRRADFERLNNALDGIIGYLSIDNPRLRGITAYLDSRESLEQVPEYDPNGIGVDLPATPPPP